MNIPQEIINNIYVYLPNYLRADLKCKISVKINMSQYKNLDLEIGKCYYKKLNPVPRISLNFHHPVRELMWAMRQQSNFDFIDVSYNL